jgi:hypothetical protein
MIASKELCQFLLSEEYKQYENSKFNISSILFINHGITYDQFIKKVKELKMENDLLFILTLPEKIIKEIIDHNTIFKKLKHEFLK